LRTKAKGQCLQRLNTDIGDSHCTKVRRF
jgi:hypothetical protein